MLPKILIGVAVVLALFVAIVASRPSAYHVERRLEMAAPAERVFGVVNDLHGFARVLVLFGSPWETIDPGVRTTFDGPAAGVGQSLAWNGNGEVGRGRMTIAESVPGRKVGIQLEFEAPMKSRAACGLTLGDAPSGTVVTWSMDGRHNFLGKAIGLFMDMDRMLGADIEKGLARLKAVAEGRPVAREAGASRRDAETTTAGT